MKEKQFQKIKAHYIHYRQQLSGLRERIKQNDLWYVGEQTEFDKKKDKSMEGAPASRTGHLFNAIQYKHADFMDNYPHINILPREESDEEEAGKLSGIMPFILENCGFKKTYSKNCYEKLKSGTAVYGVFYKQEGQSGEVDIEEIDLLRLAFQPGITDIQDSKYVFYDYFMDIDEFYDLYGEQEGLQTQATYDEERTGPERDFLNEVVVVTDCYYKVYKNGERLLHFVKFSGSAVLEFTEGKEEYKEGFYRHGKYPFVFDVLHPVPGKLCGQGVIDIAKNPQAYIDKLDEIINKNALLNSMPRHFVNENVGMNEGEFLDVSNPLVHLAGSVSEENVKEIKTGSLPSFISSHRASKIEELKEIVGNRDFSQGGTSGGVTAASAITALQNSGDKLSRDMINASYYAFSEIIWLVIELVREFYDEERTFRVLGDDARYEYVTYSNQGLRDRTDMGLLEGLITPEEAEGMGLSVSYEKPQFDITLTVEKNNPYQRSQHNELILALFNMGLFVPQNLSLGRFVISNLNFDGKDKLLAQMDEMQKKLTEQAAQGAGQTGTGVTAEPGASEVSANAMAPKSAAEEMLALPIGGDNNSDSGEEMLAVPVGEGAI